MFLCAVAILLMGCGNDGSDSRTEKNNAVSSCEKASGVDKNSQSVPAGYVDLGLSVHWKNSNESNPSDDYGFYTYDAAMKKFGSSLPTKAQLKELVDRCTWTWSDSKEGYYVKGPNGNSIFLPAAGCRNCYGDVCGVGTYGYYWSSTPIGTDYAWGLLFNSGGHRVYYYYRCDGFSVRLVQGK
jgi:uncharacterized protein (TIGR02145 family)